MVCFYGYVPEESQTGYGDQLVCLIITIVRKLLTWRPLNKLGYSFKFSLQRQPRPLNKLGYSFKFSLQRQPRVNPFTFRGVLLSLQE
jgi:hypothetical protein